MTRLMGDATHVNVPQLAAVHGLQIAAGYVTGTPDIRWTNSDWATFYPLPWVFIDQANGGPVPLATVRDVEPGAWTPAKAVDRTGWTAARPTIYCDRADLPSVLAAGWIGDLWLAIPDWQPGDALPYVTPGCTVVAVQNDFSNPAYDLSVVLDPTWPLEDPVTITIPGINAEWPVMPSLTIDTITGVMYYTGIGMDGHVWQARGVTVNGVVAWTIAPL